VYFFTGHRDNPLLGAARRSFLFLFVLQDLWAERPKSLQNRPASMRRPLASTAGKNRNLSAHNRFKQEVGRIYREKVH